MAEQHDSITFTMRLDASDLKKLFGSSVVPAAARAGAQGGGGGGGGNQNRTVHHANWLARFMGGASNSQKDDSDKSAKKNAKAIGNDPSFKSIFKPLATLYIASKALSGILRQSTIANTYGAAMGKIFGAALDILMIPFLPFFNLLLVLMTKLVAWLITSGILQEIAKVVSRAVGYLEGIAHWIVEVWHAIKGMDFGKLAELIIKGVWGAVKTIVKDPKGALMAGGLAVAGAAILNKMMLGIPLMLGKAVFSMGKGLFGLGRAAAGMLGGGGAAAEGAAAGGELAAGGAAATGAAGAATTGGAGAGVAGGGAGLLGGLGLGTGLLAAGGGLAAGVGTNYLLGKAGVHGTARQALTGAAAGAVAGGVIGSVVPVLGTGIGALAGGAIGGGIGLAKGLFGGNGDSRSGQQQGGVNVQNSNNTINLTQNNTFTNANVNQKQIADDAIKEIERRTGFKLAVRGGH